MPVGCDFVCNNEKCKAYKTSISLSGPWPMGDIDEVIASDRVQKDEKFKKYLEGVKAEEKREYACIAYPDSNAIEIKAFRLQKYCKSCKCVLIYDYVPKLEKGKKELGELLEEDDPTPTQCQRCNNKLQTFNELVKEGIQCPHCHTNLKQIRWYVNEIIEEDNK